MSKFQVNIQSEVYVMSRLIFRPYCKLSITLTLTLTQVGGMAQWLGCWSSAGRLSLIYGGQVITMWVNSKLSTMGESTRSTQPSIPLGSVNE